MNILSGCDQEILAVMNKNSLLTALKVGIRIKLAEFKIHRPHSRKLFLLQIICACVTCGSVF